MEIVSRSKPYVEGKKYKFFPLGTKIVIKRGDIAFDRMKPVHIIGVAGSWIYDGRNGPNPMFKRISHGNWCIRYQQRATLIEGASPNRWQSWRKFSVYPLRFSSKDEAEDYLFNIMNGVTFENMNGRKLSASATPITVLRNDVLIGSKRKAC